jgi:hypothetical protein
MILSAKKQMYKLNDEMSIEHNELIEKAHFI